jgi:hypothetical protein
MSDADDLALIPRSLRDKLDRVGIKLHLKEWELFTLTERRHLVDHPCDSAADVAQLDAALTALVRRYSGRAPDRLPR